VLRALRIVTDAASHATPPVPVWVGERRATRNARYAGRNRRSLG
jgi:hypothetical protein